MEITKLIDWAAKLFSDYGWYVTAILIAPLIGYALTQWIKSFSTEQIPDNRVKLFAAISTAISTFYCWEVASGKSEQAIVVAAFVGILQPYIVGWIFSKIKKYNPDFYSKINGKKKPKETERIAESEDITDRTYTAFNNDE